MPKTDVGMIGGQTTTGTVVQRTICKITNVIVSALCHVVPTVLRHGLTTFVIWNVRNASPFGFQPTLKCPTLR